MITIYVQEKPLLLINTKTEESQHILSNERVLFMDDLSPSAAADMLERLSTDEFTAGVFLHSNLDELLDAFKTKFIVIKAAGGLVYTPEKVILMIFRRGKWDLPKGKLDDGEDLEACAIREIEEETGATGLKIVQPLLTTYHTYHHKNKHILKESHWYLVKAAAKTPLQPQTDEDITECLWVDSSDIDQYKLNTHKSILKVLENGLLLL